MKYSAIYLSIFIAVFLVQTSHSQTGKLTLPFTDDGASAFIDANTDCAHCSKMFFDIAVESYNKGNLDLAGNAYFNHLYFEALQKYGKAYPAELKKFLLSKPDLLDDFFSALSEHDDLSKVYSIISDIYKSNSEGFKKYPRLAMAIAVVFDTPPPETFPHSQVSAKILKREFPKPEKAFAMWLSMREKGRLLLQPERLSIQELKYLVCTLASDADRDWVQRSVSVNLSNIEKLYPSVNYDHPRLKRKAFNWEYDDYSLKTIKTRGGICTDQSYYTSEVARCRGVPSLIFSGAGADGFHAWAAYMQKSGVWNFNVGRYEGARFVTGSTIDPQTWERASDHSLNALRENFRNGKKYRSNEIHTMFAKNWLSKKDYAKAEAAAKAAIILDSRNMESWLILIDAVRKSGKSPKNIATIQESAMKSFTSKYPDLDAKFRRDLIAYLKENGKPDEAQKLSSSIIIKTKTARPDIAMSFALGELVEYINSGDTPKLCNLYKRLLNIFKSDAAICCTSITIPTLNALIKAKKFDELDDIMKVTKQLLKKAKDDTVKSLIEDLERQIVAIKAKAAEHSLN